MGAFTPFLVPTDYVTDMLDYIENWEPVSFYEWFLSRTYDEPVYEFYLLNGFMRKYDMLGKFNFYPMPHTRGLWPRDLNGPGRAESLVNHEIPGEDVRVIAVHRRALPMTPSETLRFYELWSNAGLIYTYDEMDEVLDVTRFPIPVELTAPEGTDGPQTGCAPSGERQAPGSP